MYLYVPILHIAYRRLSARTHASRIRFSQTKGTPPPKSGKIHLLNQWFIRVYLCDPTKVHQPQLRSFDAYSDTK